MAREFSGSGQWLTATTLPVTAYPFAVSFWFKADALQNAIIWALGQDGSTDNFFQIRLAVGGELQASVRDGTTLNTAATSTFYSANTWHHCFALFQSATNRGILLDGGGQGVNTINRTPGTPDQLRIGASSAGLNAFSGSIGEHSVHGTAISLAVGKGLATGFSNPLNSVGASLRHYAPFLDIENDDWIAGSIWTETGSPTVDAAHPPITWRRHGRIYASAGGSAQDVTGGTIEPPVVQVSAPTLAYVLTASFINRQLDASSGAKPPTILADQAIATALIASGLAISPPSLTQPILSIKPDGLAVQTNLSGDFTDIDDDPSAPDGNWLTAIGPSEDTIMRATFEQPDSTLTSGAGKQEFELLVRKVGNGSPLDPTMKVDLYENGVFRTELVSAQAVTSEIGSVYNFFWDAGVLSDMNGTDVEIRVHGSAA